MISMRHPTSRTQLTREVPLRGTLELVLALLPLGIRLSGAVSPRIRRTDAVRSIRWAALRRKCLLVQAHGDLRTIRTNRNILTVLTSILIERILRRRITWFHITWVWIISSKHLSGSGRDSQAKYTECHHKSSHLDQFRQRTVSCRL